jgi:hypothetical protein
MAIFLSPYNNMYLYLFVVLLILFVISIFYFNTTKEGITFNPDMTDILPIVISDDNATISVPNKIKGKLGDDITFGGDLIANKNVRVLGGHTVTENQTVNGNTTVKGNQILKGNLSGEGTPLKVINGMNVTGIATANDGLTVKNKLSVTEGATISGGSITDTQTVNGTLNLNGRINIAGRNRLVFGSGEAKGDGDVTGTISYKNWDDKALCIVGADVGSGTRRVSIWDELQVNGTANVTAAVNCATISISSDKRIKKNIQDISSQESLDVLRHLKPVKYQFKDCLKEVIGFIAQDIQYILPTSVSTHTRVIHNIYEMCRCHKNLLTFPTFKTTDLSYEDDKPLPIKMGETIVSILGIVNESTVMIDTVFEGNIFVYGQEVNDFLSIDKNQLFTVTTSALQELDRQLQTEKQRTQSLIERISRLEKNLLL